MNPLIQNHSLLERLSQSQRKRIEPLGVRSVQSLCRAVVVGRGLGEKLVNPSKRESRKGVEAFRAKYAAGVWQGENSGVEWSEFIAFALPSDWMHLVFVSGDFFHGVFECEGVNFDA